MFYLLEWVFPILDSLLNIKNKHFVKVYIPPVGFGFYEIWSFYLLIIEKKKQKLELQWNINLFLALRIFRYLLISIVRDILTLHKIGLNDLTKHDRPREEYRY